MLAGPILRRCEASRVCIWLATSTPVTASAEVFRFASQTHGELEQVGSGDAKSVKAGRNLFVHLIPAMPDADAFPTDELLAYDIEITVDGSEPERLADLGLLDGPVKLTYEDLPLPTFFIRKDLAALNLLHGSCRLLHGKGEDSLVAGDEVLERHAKDVTQRPGALFFTGDQIYADEVAGAMMEHVTRLGAAMLGPEDDTSVPDMPPLSSIPVNGRQELTADKAKFTSDKASNHLMSFGEFAGMALATLSNVGWPETFPSSEEAIPMIPGQRSATLKARRKYDSEVADLETAHRSMPRFRRVLANIPVYTMFDDHDVTDDWNLNGNWQGNVRGSASGRRIVANALAAFWTFQGWGNDPDLYDDSFIDTVTGFYGGGGTGPEEFESALWDFSGWSYHAPTNPPAIVLDTRTQRSFDSPEGAARLMKDSEMARVKDLVRASGYKPEAPLILVSAVPVFGLELQERRQKFLVDKVGPYEIDFEAWHSNLHGFVDFMHLLIDELELKSCVLLSGDVHYGLNARASFSIEDKELPFAQLVSSSQKHSGEMSKTALNLLGKLVSKEHERVGWDRPPKMDGASSGLKDRIARKPANTDEWSEDSPVFLAPKRVQQMNIKEPPIYREWRSYVRTSGPDSSMVIGENNLGLVSITGHEVVHRLLSRDKNETNVHTATIDLAGPPSES